MFIHGLASVAIVGVVLTVGGLGCTAPPDAIQVRDSALKWLAAGPSAAADDSLVWHYGTGGSVVEVADVPGGEGGGESANTVRADGEAAFTMPVYADGDDYYYQEHSAAFEDQAVWVSLNPPMLKSLYGRVPDAPPGPTADAPAGPTTDTPADRLLRAGLVMALVNGVSPYVLLADLTVEGRAEEGGEQDEQQPTWVIRGSASPERRVRERLPAGLWPQVQPAVDPTFRVRLEVERETGRPTVMVVTPSRGGAERTYRWSRLDAEPVLPEWAVELRSLIVD